MDPTLVYIVSWSRVPPNNVGPVSYVVRMKKSQAKHIEEILQHNVEADHLFDGTVEEAGELFDVKDIMKLMNELPGSAKEWMP